MDFNFVDQTAQILFSDLLNRSNNCDLTDALVKAIAETAYRRALMLADARKDVLALQSQPVKEMSNNSWVEYAVPSKSAEKQEKLEKVKKVVEEATEVEDVFETKFEPELEDNHTNEVYYDRDEDLAEDVVKPKLKKVAKKQTDKVTTKETLELDKTESEPTPVRKRGRPKGSVKKNKTVA